MLETITKKYGEIRYYVAIEKCTGEYYLTYRNAGGKGMKYL